MPKLRKHGTSPPFPECLHDLMVSEIVFLTFIMDTNVKHWGEEHSRRMETAEMRRVRRIQNYETRI